MTVILRKNWGTLSPVDKVYAYDPTHDIVLVRYAQRDDCQVGIDRVSVAELEAIADDDCRTFQDVPTVLRRMAREIVNDLSDN